MKILFTSYVYAPSLGGIESVSSLLVHEFLKAGHEVKVVTKTKETDDVPRPYDLIRNPSAPELLKLTKWCDIFFQNNISLTLSWPLLFIHRPWIVAHHTWLSNSVNWYDFRPHLKRFLLRYATNASISKPIADALPVPSVIVGNPYSPEIFRVISGIPRDRELIFLGRLVSDKGIDLIIKALAQLKERGLAPRLTIVGFGPQLPFLKELAGQLGVIAQIKFIGPMKGDELAHIVNGHQIMIVPSYWSEPFGLVALEGIACGCAVIASHNGGLPEAVGPCGMTFPPGDVTALADSIERGLTQPQFRENLQHDARDHLAKFEPSHVAQRYLELFAKN
jgi:glycosyltransferase involved in cell wall biosynthesis